MPTNHTARKFTCFKYLVTNSITEVFMHIRKKINGAQLCKKMKKVQFSLSCLKFKKRKDVLLNLRFAVIDMYEKWLPHPA